MALQPIMANHCSAVLTAFTLSGTALIFQAALRVLSELYNKEQAAFDYFCSRKLSRMAYSASIFFIWGLDETSGAVSFLVILLFPKPDSEDAAALVSDIAEQLSMLETIKNEVKFIFSLELKQYELLPLKPEVEKLKKSLVC